MFSLELDTPTRITSIKEAGVRVCACVCVAGGPAPGEVAAITLSPEFTPQRLFSPSRLGKRRVDLGISHQGSQLLRVSAGPCGNAEARVSSVARSVTPAALSCLGAIQSNRLEPLSSYFGQDSLCS